MVTLALADGLKKRPHPAQDGLSDAQFVRIIAVGAQPATLPFRFLRVLPVILLL